MNKPHISALLALSVLLVNPLQGHAGTGHEHDQTPAGQTETAAENHDDNQTHAECGRDKHGEEEGGIRLNAEQRRLAGIQVDTLMPQAIISEIKAPGEIVLNSYATRLLTPRIEAQVVARHVRLGDKVSTGQVLVTLSSVTMAAAQGRLLVTEKEWQRVRKLGRKVVSARRYQEARIAAQQARAKLLAYGMTKTQIKQLLRGERIDQANGQFALLAPINGTVIRDDFITGQMVQPGDLLFEISDESRLWVEARLEPAAASLVSNGSPARVLVGKQWIPAKVIQIHHTLDQATRTLAVRLLLENPQDRLHPGQFVTASMQTGKPGASGMILPLDAVLRSADGDWQVFVENKCGEFEPREVKVLRQWPGRVQIDGLKAGTRVVIRGAFFVQSELSKSGFEVHDH